MKKVLVLDLDETLISWIEDDDIQHDFRIRVMGCNYRIRTRPYLQEFLQAVSKNYELVVWSASHPEYANGIVAQLSGYGGYSLPPGIKVIDGTSLTMGSKRYRTLMEYFPGCNVYVVDDDKINYVDAPSEKKVLCKPWHGRDDTDDELIKVSVILDSSII